MQGTKGDQTGGQREANRITGWLNKQAPSGQEENGEEGKFFVGPCTAPVDSYTALIKYKTASPAVSCWEEKT